MDPIAVLSPFVSKVGDNESLVGNDIRSNCSQEDRHQAPGTNAIPGQWGLVV